MVLSYRLLAILLFIAFLFLPSAAKSAPLCIVQPDYSDYFFGFPNGCTVGDQLLSRFGYGPEGGTVINFPTPISSPNMAGLGFTLTNAFGDFSVGSSETKSFGIAYTTSVGAGSLINGDLFSLLNTQVTGSGSIKASETACLNGTFQRPLAASPSCTSGLTALANSTSPQLAATTTFSPVQSIDLILTVTLSGGASGTASVGGLQMEATETPVAPTPEPSSLLLIGTGLIIIGLIRRRKMRQQFVIH